MTNNLIFSSGASLSICPTQVANAPRMVGGGWRWWHVNASCADAVTALESGIARREYESITGADEEDNPTTEVLTEDLSAYTVGGCVVDHRDGTSTIWARKETELERVNRLNAEYAENLAALGVEV